MLELGSAVLALHAELRQLRLRLPRALPLALAAQATGLPSARVAVAAVRASHVSRADGQLVIAFLCRHDMYGPLRVRLVAHALQYSVS